MSKSRASRQRVQQRNTRVPIPRSQVIARWLSLSFVAILGVLLVLVALNIPLGQGYFIYRYSPVRNLRTLRAAPTVLIAASVCGALWFFWRNKSRLANALLIIAAVLTTLWLFWAPPNPLEQHAFNLRSLSADGAFVMEAEVIESLPLYLRHFEERLQLAPKQLGGTRLLSNPPGTTIFAWAVLHAFPPQVQPLGGFERFLVQVREVPPSEVISTSNSIKFAAALCIVWLLAMISVYLLGRVFLSPVGATVFATIACFNPATVHFVPGKDPGQLLTINLMLLGWLAGWKHPRAAGWAPLLGGAALAIGSTFGLIHIWVALATFLAVTWDALAQRSAVARKRLLINTLAAAAGALGIFLVAYLALGWNIPSQLLAVSRRFGPIQQTFPMSRPIWFLIGLPSFLLFLSPGFWTLVGLRAHRKPFGLGARLALCTAAVMLLTYVMGVTYELPRLWVAFFPPLTLALAMDLPLLRFPVMPKKAVLALMLILTVQIVFTACHWTLFDARETEYRLITKRFYQ